MTASSKKETLNFQAEVKQLLNLVVHSLYSNKEIFLRELISNASDAADKLRFEALSDASLFESEGELKIHISFDEKERTITVSDNGIGMSREEVIANLGTIAKSGTREFLMQMTGDQKKDAHLVGQFGVGFYSSFIVADKVTVITRRAGAPKEQGVRWESNGEGEYTIADVEKNSRGTDIILHMKAGEDDFLNNWRLRSIITKYSDHISLPILMHKMAGLEEKKPEKDKDTAPASPEWEVVNRATALWTLPKKTITDEQYQELYKHIAHDFEGALIWAHNQVEGGSLEYISLLFIPSHAPTNLWQPEMQHGLKLYVQRVFIMDKVAQFMPSYLRFVRGIVDTNALPLNISREILQDNPVMTKLRNALVKRALDLLEKLAKDPEKYLVFWKQFGNVLKEGPAEDFTNRERVAKLLLFSSTQTDSPIQTVSLEEYVKRMKPEQKKIYYITAESFNAAKASPHLEIFRKNNVEVLLLSDRIDEWLVGHLVEFDGKHLHSVAKGDINLDEIENTQDKETKEEQQKKEATVKTEFTDMVTHVKKVLGEEVKDVRVSHRLTLSPSCLVADDNDMGIQLQRLLKAAGQEVADIKPIFELNPDHPLVKLLKEEKNEDRFQEWAHILFDQAVLAEGGQLKDPASFVQRVNKLFLELKG